MAHGRRPIIDMSKLKNIFIVLHHFKGEFIGVEEKIFNSRQDAEDHINWLYENNHALDHKDNFYIHEVTDEPAK